MSKNSEVVVDALMRRLAISISLPDSYSAGSLFNSVKMSYNITKFEGSSNIGTFSKFLINQVVKVTPSEEFISELPSCLSVVKNRVKIKPFVSLKEICEPFLDAIIDFNVRSDDVFVCSIPKCGSSWMQTIVWLLTHDLNYETIKNVVRREQMGDFDEVGNVPIAREIASKLRENDKQLGDREALKMAWEEVFKTLDEPRVIKTHFSLYFLPRRIWSKGAKVIYVVRNTKDMTVSRYHMLRNFFHSDVTMDDIVNGIISDTCYCAPNIDHMLEFWRIKHLPNVLFIAYEDIVNDSFESIKKISDFLQCSHSDEQLKELTEFISFDNMKKIKSINREGDVAEMERLVGKNRPDSNFT